MVLSRHNQINVDAGAVVLQQYNEVSSYLRQKWLSQSDQVPVVDDIGKLLLTYPHCRRCPELSEVFNIVVCGSLRRRYTVNFLDLGRSTLGGQDLLSSLKFVRSWMNSRF